MPGTPLLATRAPLAYSDVSPVSPKLQLSGLGKPSVPAAVGQQRQLGADRVAVSGHRGGVGVVLMPEGRSTSRVPRHVLHRAGLVGDPRRHVSLCSARLPLPPGASSSARSPGRRCSTRSVRPAATPRTRSCRRRGRTRSPRRCSRPSRGRRAPSHRTSPARSRARDPAAGSPQWTECRLGARTASSYQYGLASIADSVTDAVPSAASRPPSESHRVHDRDRRVHPTHRPMSSEKRYSAAAAPASAIACTRASNSLLLARCEREHRELAREVVCRDLLRCAAPDVDRGECLVATHLRQSRHPADRHLERLRRVDRQPHQRLLQLQAVVVPNQSRVSVVGTA